MNSPLSQEEIDRLMNQASESKNTDTADLKKEMTQMETDVIGEVGNISMSQAATTLSELLGNTVRITTPKVSATTMENIVNESKRPTVNTMIEFKKGITGNNMLMLDINDSAKIADLMMGGVGDVSADTVELSEIELSAVSEAMNQMIGSASTAMATMFNRIVDIHPPSINIWDGEAKTEILESKLKIPVCKISFELEVENVLKSEIMQVFSMDAVTDIVQIMLNDEAIVVETEPKVESNEKDQTDEKEQTPEEVQEKVSVKKPVLQELEPHSTQKQPRNLDLIMDVPLEFSVMLGESQKSIRDILSLGTGSVVELDKMTEEPLDIFVNGKKIAQGEVVVINENFGIRITSILSKENRIQEL